MKKLITIAAMAMLVGATVSSAQTTNVSTTSTGIVTLVGPIKVDAKVSLSNKGSANVVGAEYARVKDTSDGSIADVYGTAPLLSSVATTNQVDPTNITIVVNSVLNTDTVFLVSDTPVDLGKGKFAESLGGNSKGAFGMSNSVWTGSGTLKAGGKGKGTNITFSAQGIWKEGVSAFKASVKTSKTQ